MVEHEVVKAAPQIWYVSKRWLRTLVQTGIPSFTAFAGVLPQIIDALGLPVGWELYRWLLLVAGGVTAVAAGLSRVMAIQSVNTFLAKYLGLGSVPASTLTAKAEDVGKA